MRKKETSTNGFRRLLGELSTLMAYEVTRDMPTQPVEIETPLETMTGTMMDGKKLVLVSILRAGNGILDGVLNVVPGARVGHIGLYRDPKTLQAVEYYFKMPQDMEERDVIVVDPMLATGNSAVAAIDRVKRMNPKSIKLPVPADLPRRPAHDANSPSRRAGLHRRGRPPAQRPRLYPARPGRRGRPDFRDAVSRRALRGRSALFEHHGAQHHVDQQLLTRVEILRIHFRLAQYQANLAC